MAGNDEFTNLSLVKVGRYDKEVKLASESAIKADSKKDEDAAAFKRLMAKMQEEARPPWMHGRGALDHDDLLYLKEQSAAEKDAERMRDLREKQAFKTFQAAASNADSLPGSALRVEPKVRSGIRQQSLLKNIVEVRPRHAELKPKRLKTDHGDGEERPEPRDDSRELTQEDGRKSNLERLGSGITSPTGVSVQRQSSGSALLGIAYETTGSDDSGEEEVGDEVGVDKSQGALVGECNPSAALNREPNSTVRKKGQ